MFSMEKFDLRPQQVIQKKMIIALQVMEPEKAGKPGAWGKTGGKPYQYGSVSKPCTPGEHQK